MRSNVRRSLSVAVAAVVVAVGALAVASAGSGSVTKWRKPHLRERRILAIALKTAAAAGDSTPTLIQHSEGSRHQANLIASGDIVGGSQWSYLIAERGRFTANSTYAPRGGREPSGTVLTLIVSARTGQVTDTGISNRYPDLAKLGHVYTDRSTAVSSYGIEIQAVYDQHGNPSVVANFRPKANLAHPIWEICSPASGSVCTPAGKALPGLEPGASAAGTVFQAIATYAGHAYTARTAVWRGQVRATRGPQLEGPPQAGQLVRPKPALWRGGWQPDPAYKPQLGAMSGGRAPSFDFLSVEACRTRSGNHCIILTSGDPTRGSAPQPVRVARRFVGWYLFAFDQRFAADTVFDLVAYGNPGSIASLKVGPTVARSEPAGPIRS